jgi:uncharacterized protein YegL
MTLKLFVEYNNNIKLGECILSQKNASELNLPSGGTIFLKDPLTEQTVQVKMVVQSEDILDFSIKVARETLAAINFNGLEINVHISLTTQSPSFPTGTPLQVPPPSNIPVAPPGMPAPPQESLVPPLGMPTPPGIPDPASLAPVETMAPPDPYPNKIDPQLLVQEKQEKSSAVVSKVRQAHASLEGKVVLNQNIISQLNLFANALIGWEDPWTREKGSARVKIGKIPEDEILMDENTIYDTKCEAPHIVLYSLEPPIIPQEVLTLELQGKPDMGGFIEISPRNSLTLQIQSGDVLSGEDDLTGAFFAGRIQINDNLSDEIVVVDQELLDASGVGSYEVELKKNLREIIPLQSIDLGVSPVTGENVWDVISQARSSIDVIKQWLGNYIIFKGIKLHWKTANIAIEVLNTVPDLSGDVLSSVGPNCTLELKPMGLVTFNAILILDISRSMMARDVRVTNIGPALEGIKAAMRDPDIQAFLKKFKPGINVPRRLSAAFAAILFLSEKVGRGFGEKVAVIRFADEAQILPMGEGKLWMDSSSGQKGVLENCARTIVSEIGNAYGQATNMGPAMRKTRELLEMFAQDTTQPDQPSMVVLLTDGSPTDGPAFMEEIEELAKNPNVVLYIIGLGNPDDSLMKEAAAKCAGEYFKPEDSGELLKWYSKRARDLTLKIRRE